MQTLTCSHDPQAIISVEDQGGSVISVSKPGICNTLRANSHNHEPIVTCYASSGYGDKVESNIASTLSTDHDNRITGNNAALILESVLDDDNELENTTKLDTYKMLARRIVPVEAEALMGFPRNYTRIPWKGKPEEDCPDSPRYKCCGNSFGVNVIRWIGMRIELIEKWCKQNGGSCGDTH